MNAPWKWGDIWPYLLAVGILAVGWFAYRKYFAKRSGAESEPAYTPPPTPPHVRALRELRELEDKKLWQRGLMKAYYSECTEIVRRFFEGRFGFPALELTSDETLDQLRRFDAASADNDALKEFFGRADIVKFAKGQPSPDEHARELSVAYDIVRSMAQEHPEDIEEEKKEEVLVAG